VALKSVLSKKRLREAEQNSCTIRSRSCKSGSEAVNFFFHLMQHKAHICVVLTGGIASILDIYV